MILRVATPHDVESVARLWLNSRGGAVQEHRERALRWFSDERPRDLQLVVEYDGEVVGWARAAYMVPPDDVPPNCVPEGWYLLGMDVAEAARRRGIGRALTRARVAWLRERTSRIWYFVRCDNHASIALHAEFGFEEVANDVWFPGKRDEVRVVLLRVG